MAVRVGAGSIIIAPSRPARTIPLCSAGCRRDGRPRLCTVQPGVRQGFPPASPGTGAGPGDSQAGQPRHEVQAIQVMPEKRPHRLLSTPP